MVEISTSILSVKKGEESKTFFALEKAKTDYFHIDVMDGKFVEKNTYNKMLEYASYIKRISNLPLDIHLMVEDVNSAIDDFLAVEPNIITFHYEACKDKEEVMQIIKKIKDNHCKVGLSVKPETKIEEIYEFLPYIHMCLVMTVEPGKGGQTLLTDMVDTVVDGMKIIPSNVNLAGAAFYQCKSFKEIIIPKSVQYIDRLAFRYCRNLKAVYIPDSVKRIGMYAFSDCQEITTVRRGRSIYREYESMGLIATPPGNKEKIERMLPKYLHDIIKELTYKEFINCNMQLYENIKTEREYDYNYLDRVKCPRCGDWYYVDDGVCDTCGYPWNE